MEVSSSSTFPLFVDTSLGTHLLIPVSSDCTVADLEGKIMTEHLLSFPDIGEISVQATKIKRRGSLYSLSNSMVVRRAFEGTKGARFLHIDLVRTTSVVKSQTGLTKVIMSEGDGQPVSDVLETQTLPDIHLQEQSGQGLDNRLDREGPEAEELDVEGNAAVGSAVQQKGKDFAYQESKDGRSENVENAGVSADMGVPVAGNKEKSRGRHNALEIYQGPDDKSEQPYVKKRRRKKKDGSSKQLIVGTVMPKNGFQEKHDNYLAPSEGFPSKSSHVDSLQAPVDAKQKRKKKKHLSKYDETYQNEMVDSSLNKATTLGKQTCEEEYVEESSKNHTDLGKESDAADLFECTREVLDDDKSEQISTENKKKKKKKDGSSKDLLKDLLVTTSQEKQETNPGSAEVFSSKPSHVDSSLQPPVGFNQKRKRKKHLSKNIAALQTELVDNSSNKADDATQGKQAANVNHAEKLLKSLTDLRKESDVADLMEESTQKMLETVLLEDSFHKNRGTNLVSSDGIPSELSGVDSSLHKPVDAKQKSKRKKHLSKIDEASETDMVGNSLDKADDASLGKHPSEVNPVEELGKMHTELRKESDTADLIKESIPKERDGRFEELRVVNPLSVNPKESTDTPKPSTDFPVQDENNHEASGNNHAQLSKVSDTIADADVANKRAMESGIPSAAGTESSNCNKRKKREKVELPNTRSNTHESVNSPRDLVAEEIQNKTSSSHQEKMVGSTVLSRPKERKKKRSQKKTESIELHQESGQQNGNQEAVSSLVDRIIEQLSKERNINRTT